MCNTTYVQYTYVQYTYAHPLFIFVWMYHLGTVPLRCSEPMCSVAMDIHCSCEHGCATCVLHTSIRRS